MSRPETGGPRRVRLDQLFEALQKEETPQPKVLTNAVGMKLVLVPSGSFLMGAAADDALKRRNELPQREVILSRPFYMGIHLVTQEQYLQVTGRNPARFHAANGGGPEHPVELVSWEDASGFLQRLSEMPAVVQAGMKYRLPTEAEWEYACRAGTRTAFCYSPVLSSLQANFDGHFASAGAPGGPFLQKTSKVGAYGANNFGLFDMHGNVWEWCADWYEENYYSKAPGRDPEGPTEGMYRVVRGGCWRSHAATCRAAYRNALVPNNRDPYTGFRVVAQLAKGAPGR